MGDGVALQMWKVVTILDSSLKCFFYSLHFLISFTKLRKATISFFHVCLSAWFNWAPTGQILIKSDIENF
jgi:hypothetical protein